MSVQDLPDAALPYNRLLMPSADSSTYNPSCLSLTLDCFCAGSGLSGSRCEVTEHPRSVTSLPQPSPSHPLDQLPLRPARHKAELQPAVQARKSSTPYLQQSNSTSTSTTLLLGSSPSLKHRSSSSSSSKKPLGNNSNPATKSVDFALLQNKLAPAAPLHVQTAATLDGMSSLNSNQVQAVLC